MTQTNETDEEIQAVKDLGIVEVELSNKGIIPKTHQLVGINAVGWKPSVFLWVSMEGAKKELCLLFGTKTEDVVIGEPDERWDKNIYSIMLKNITTEKFNETMKSILKAADPKASRENIEKRATKLENIACCKVWSPTWRFD